MYELIKNNLNTWVKLTEDEFDVFSKKLIVKKIKRKEFVLQEGEVCKFVFFINKGSLRYFYNVEGEEQTGQFFFENAWYTDYESFLTTQPSKQNIQALEPSELLFLPKTALYELYETYPKFERFGRLMAENAYLGSKRKNETLLNESPEERYLNLIKTRPKVIDRVSLKHIASYLGIKPESLSRIRKRLFEHRKYNNLV